MVLSLWVFVLLPAAAFAMFANTWFASVVAAAGFWSNCILENIVWFRVPKSTLKPTTLLDVAQSFLFIKFTTIGLDAELEISKASVLHL